MLRAGAAAAITAINIGDHKTNEEVTAEGKRCGDVMMREEVINT